MVFDERAVRYFLGVNSPGGFVSRFEHLADYRAGWRYIILKGMPGGGKSTLLRKVASAFSQQGLTLEYIHCATDVSSLDGLLLPELKVAIADGTPPHTIEPRYPGVFEHVIMLNDRYNHAPLYERQDEIVALNERFGSLQELCCRFIGAASSLIYDTYQIALANTDHEKLAGFAQRLGARELPPKAKKTPGEAVRFLSAVTSDGHVFLEGSLPMLAQRLYFLQDDYGAFSRILLQALRTRALAEGYEVVSCYCPLAPFEKLEHLFIPELSLGFSTCNRFHTPAVEPYKVIHARRFTDLNHQKAYKQRLAFNRKTAVQMLGKASGIMREAHDVHMRIEELYRPAIDHSQASVATARVIDMINEIQNTAAPAI